MYVGSWYKIEGQFLIKRTTYHISNCKTSAYSNVDVTFIMHALYRYWQMQARNDRDFRKSSISPASCKQIDSSPKIKILENCYVCFYKFINGIISYLLFFHNEHIIIWSFWPNIRFLPSIVAEKNATTNILEGRTDRQTDRGKTVYPLSLRGYD